MIKIDMFDVGLGSSILLRFDNAGDPVTVLCDGGHRLSGLVHTELGKVLDGRRRIDLIIATHYDADHLDGLVPIILDDTIDIGEIWLPPVADDTLDERHGRPHRPEDLLGERMLNAEDGGVSASYKQRKQRDIKRIEVLERAMDSETTTRVDPEPSNEGSDDLDGYFRTIWNAYRAKMPLDGCEHAPDIEVEESRYRKRAWAFDDPRHWWWIAHHASILWTDRLAEAVEWMRYHPDHAVLALNFERLKAGAAKDAINVSSLQAVIDALRTRRLRPSFETIRTGEPVVYGWDRAAKRFITPASADALALTLMGPSVKLVERQRDHLPVSQSMFFAVLRWDEMYTVSVSNQLSYVARFDSEGQKVLVCGDSAFADFAPYRSRKGAYHVGLIDAMRDLNVVQVAHHGGANGHFYRVMNKAGIRTAKGPMFLLLSHEYDSAVRPSKTFAANMRRLGSAHVARLLFTNPPLSPNAATYKALVAPPTPGVTKSHGDVRLRFDGTSWIVDQHFVKV